MANTYKSGDIVLVDTNVIIEAHRTDCWNAIAGFFNIHTVEKVIEETLTGWQNRREEEIINQADLRQSIKHVESITETQRLKFNIDNNHPVLDDGERDLLIYASLIEADIWLLNSPDNAAVRFAHAKNWSDRLVSLEEMVKGRARLKNSLRNNYTQGWLSEFKTKLHLERL